MNRGLEIDEGWYGWDYGSNKLRGIYWEWGRVVVVRAKEIQHPLACELYID